MSIISWNEYFMSLAILSSYRSKDPKRKVGACIIDKKNRIIGIGYNGFPTGCHDNNFSWKSNSESTNLIDSKHGYVIHAEINAILNTSRIESLNDCALYVTLFPCHECAKIIIQSGIKFIVYLHLDGHVPEKESFIVARKLFDAVGIKYEQFNITNKEINIKI